MNMRAQILFAALVTASSAASANPEWVAITADEELVAYVDQKSLKEIDGTRRLWIRINFAKPQQYEGREYDVLAQYAYVSCRDESYGIKSQAFYYGGESVDSFTVPTPSMTPAVPGSRGASWVSFACDPSYRADAIRLHRRFGKP